MESVKNILNKDEKLKQILAKGQEIKKQYLAQGFIKTNFGWMHRDWISEAFRRKFIAGSNPEDYKLVVNYSMETKAEKIKGRDWDSKEVLTPKMDMVDDPRNSGKKTMRFFNWLEDKWEVFKQVRQEQIS